MITVEGSAGPDAPEWAQSERYVVYWSDGLLMGDPYPVGCLQRMALRRQGEAVGPQPSGFTLWNHLSDPRSFLVLVSEWFAPGYVVSGTVPPEPQYAEGVVF